MRRTILFLLCCLTLVACQREYEPNPDPNHTHADFAVWIEGKRINFSDPKYMSGFSFDEKTHDEEDEYHNEYLHLHDGVGHVIHSHKSGMTLGEFFSSLGFGMSEDCFLLASGERTCENGPDHWRMFLNGEEVPFNPSYSFSDMDIILLTYGSSAEEIEEQLRLLTDDACLYSRTCPWRGSPPVENCVADPAVPCTVPEEDL